METIINVDGKEVRMRASALIPRLYRFKFQRDLIQDIGKLQKTYLNILKKKENATEEEKNDARFSALDLTIFENVAYIMAKHADSSVPDTPEEWLDSFNMFSIYQILPEILKLWNVSNQTTSISKKK
jgi:hypothetical protein